MPRPIIFVIFSRSKLTATETSEHVIDRCAQVRRRIQQSAVQVEDNNRKRK